MQPKRIVLVRHGRSEANEDATMYSSVPDYKIALVENGREEAKAAGQKIAEVIQGSLCVYEMRPSDGGYPAKRGDVWGVCVREMSDPKTSVADLEALPLRASI